MTTLSRRQFAYHGSLPLSPGLTGCDHHGMAYYRVDPPYCVTRCCRTCGQALGPVELRCVAQIADGSRRCLAPGRHDGLCRAHRARAAA